MFRLDSAAQAIGEGYADEAVVSKSYEISGTAYCGGDSFFAVGDTCHATYYTQVGSSLTTKLFEGGVVVTRAADHQTQGDFETQEISLRSTGSPTVPA
ncbi:MAG: hypothetical protein HYU66_07630 [Armatimonadetes bacterium]|nr:hypothetical protein [Armatimonadota bacterium]